MTNQILFDEKKGTPNRFSSDIIEGDFSSIRSLTSQFLLADNRIDQNRLMEMMKQFYAKIDSPNKEFFEGYLRAFLDLIREKNFRDLSEAEYVRYLEKSAYALPLLFFLEKEGSMSRQALAQKLNLKEPRLSNLMSDLELYRVFSSVKIGKEKFCSITAKGEEVLQSFQANSLALWTMDRVLRALGKINPTLKSKMESLAEKPVR